MGTMAVMTGYVRLLVLGNVKVTGTSGIQVQPGCKLEIYVMGTTMIAGNGIINSDGEATAAQLYSLGTGDVNVTGNGQLTAVVYAPQSSVTFSGGGASGQVTGAFVGKTISIGGKTSFHYDEALKQNGPYRGYAIVTWQEL